MNIKFIYSTSYDKSLNYMGKIVPKYIIMIKIGLLTYFWKKNQNIIEKILNEIANLSFKKEELFCNLNSVSSMSNPFSIKFEKISFMKDNLIHELIHIILTQNNIAETKGWKQIQQDFKNETVTTRNHILIHALHYLFLMKFNPSRKKYIMNYSQNIDYIRSWNIVNKIGAQNIVDSYITR